MKLNYSLNKDVYLVDGKANGAIYDLTNHKLYSVNKNLLEFIRKLIRDGEWKFNEEEIKIFSELEKNQLIVKTDKPIKEQSILSLKKDIKPEFAWLEITQQCNLRCKFCYEKSDCTLKEKTMTMDDFHKAIDFLINYGVKKIQFIGGEPTLHPKLKQMIEEVKDKFDFIEVYTNATFINQEWCDFFKKNNIHIAISMHSYIPEEHDKITQVKGSYTLVKRGVDLVIKNKIPYRIAAIQNKDINIGKKPDGVEYTLYGGSPRMVGRSDISQMDFNMFKKRAITKETFRSPIKKYFVEKAVSGHQCFCKNFYIAYNLEVFPCVMERRISHGFIKDSKNLSFVKDEIFNQYSKDYIDGCKNCEYRYVCYDCRPDALNRGIKAKPWYCSYQPDRGQWLNLETMFNDLSTQKIQTQQDNISVCRCE